MSNDKLYNVLNSGNKHAKYAFLLISANTFSHFLLLCLIFRHVRNCLISIFPHNTWVSIWTIRTIAVRIYILAHYIFKWQRIRNPFRLNKWHLITNHFKHFEYINHNIMNVSGYLTILDMPSRIKDIYLNSGSLIFSLSKS